MNKKVIKLYKKIEEIRKEIETIQSNCTHPHTDIKYCNSTGNYDRASDLDWVEVTCKECNKWWIE